MKMVICDKCGAEVTKRSTIRVGNVRMCRSHDEAIKEAQDALIKSNDLNDAMNDGIHGSLVRVLRDIRAVDEAKYRLMMASIYFNRGSGYASKLRIEVEAEVTSKEEASENISRSITMAAVLEAKRMNKFPPKT